MKLVCLALSVVLFSSCSHKPNFDIVLRNGLVCDGSGAICQPGGVAINADTIAKVGNVTTDLGRADIDVQGQVISPGFINIQSGESGLFADGRGVSELSQGVTLDVFGQGYDVTWHSFAEGLDTLAKPGIAPNIASFIGAATPRIYLLGDASRVPTQPELDKMCALTAQAMEDGALGVASTLSDSLVNQASTDELVALAKVAAGYKGMYISHIPRGDQELTALDQLITVARQAHIPVEIYNWQYDPQSIAKIATAKAEGLQITADIYTYPSAVSDLGYLRNQLVLPWVSLGSFAPVYPRYVGDAKLLRVSEALRKMTFLPASNMGIDHRGLLKPTYFADITVFNPATISTGVSEVFVNGKEVIHNGVNTGAKPGRVIRRLRG